MTAPRIEITSVKNPHVRHAVRLRHNRYRKQTGKTIVDGVRECRRALDAGVELHELFVDRSAPETSELQYVVDSAEQKGAVIRPADPTVMDRLRFGQRTSPCVAIVSIPRYTLDQLDPPPDACIAIVEGVEKPGNLGAILRSADGAGIAAVVAADGPTELFQPNVIRASLGTVFTIRTCSASSAEVRQWLAARSYQVVAACVDGTRPYYDVDFTHPTAIILGSEANGISPAWKPLAQSVQLPMHGIADSLNVAATAAVLFYEVLRQREVGNLEKL